jgi:hypothetical protein
MAMHKIMLVKMNKASVASTAVDAILNADPLAAATTREMMLMKTEAMMKDIITMPSFFAVP